MLAELPVAHDQVCSACLAVMEKGSREGLAGYLGVSIFTIDRMRTTANESRWTDKRIDDLQKFEEACLGTRTIRHARLASLETERIGNPDVVEQALSREIGAEAFEIQKVNAILADGRADVAELKALLPDLDREAERIRQLRADIMARIRREEGR